MPRKRAQYDSDNSAPCLDNPFGCIPCPNLPDWLRGQVRRAEPLTSPLAIG
ncbi:hypothetical protein D3C77_255820 [compost metagenome]